MHYVTEDELREAFAAAPFGRYELPEGSRLTPGARQFLIDFRIAFGPEASPRGEAGSVGAPRGTEDGCELGALVHDANLLGAGLRLLARRSLGVDNSVAREAESLGRRWQVAGSPQDLVLGGEGDATAPELPPQAPAPPFDAGVHPVYFEMSCAHAQLGRFARTWGRAQEGAGPQEARVIAAWLRELSGMCETLRASVERAGREV